MGVEKYGTVFVSATVSRTVHLQECQSLESYHCNSYHCFFVLSQHKIIELKTKEYKELAEHVKTEMEKLV